MIKVNFGEYVIDVNRSRIAGHFCFLPIVIDEKTGESGTVQQITIWGTKPPVEDAVILGFMWEGSQEDLERWVRDNKQWLDKLNFAKKEVI